MTDNDLTSLVRQHVTYNEPPFLLSPDKAIRLGRRQLIRRRIRRGIAGALVAGAAVPIALSIGNPWSQHAGTDPVTADRLNNYDARQMPTFMDQRVRGVLERSGLNLGPVRFTAGDSQGRSLPTKYYAKASHMSVAYGSRTDDRFQVSLTHARSEAEGNPRKNCANDLAEGFDFTCNVSTTATGDTVTTRVTAIRRLDRLEGGGWGIVTEEELRTGITSKHDPSQAPIDRSKVYFARAVESVHSKTFLTTVEETVKAPNLAEAGAAWRVPVPDLIEIATDPQLVIPAPPIGPNGCPWTLPGSQVTCNS